MLNEATVTSFNIQNSTFKILGFIQKRIPVIHRWIVGFFNGSCA
jgi:hypothetical protein